MQACDAREMSMATVQKDKPAETVEASQRPKYRITVYDAWCKKCGICVEFCPKNVLESDQFGAPEPMHPELCIGCTQCVLHCPDFAITVSVDERKGEKAEG
jgi:2-oxoglutarate ferredoxin oxidoreductase subunit delta